MVEVLKTLSLSCVYCTWAVTNIQIIYEKCMYEQNEMAMQRKNQFISR